ncbi:MAG: DUF5103 domain-containing protein [Bacteroidota bacterium]
MRILLSIFFLFLSGKSPVQRQKRLEFIDKSYEEEIKTVQLYPNTNRPEDVFGSPAVPIDRNTLVLEFDDLVESHEDYRVMFIHCNADWTQSKLKPLDYLSTYNEFMVNQFEYSIDTKIGYVHYTFKLPNVKQTGNYLLVAYRGSDTKDIIISKRFMVYQRDVGIEVTSNRIGLTSIDRRRQKIDFEVRYPKLEIVNPQEQVKVVIRQNQRWDNIMTPVKPLFIKEAQSVLEYRFFEREDNFFAGNEFRIFDLRSVRYPGQNVARVRSETYPSMAYIMTDRGRGTQAYAQYEDINGDFYIQNTDTGNGKVQSDYLTVNFSLNLSQPVGGSIYVVGKINNYLPSEPMTEIKSGNYSYQTILKQGIYNYQYVVKGDTLSPNFIEGDHFEAENEYEILVYFRPMNLPADLLIGYTQITLNSRNN